MAKQSFSGETTMAPILGAKFWTKDTVVRGTVVGSFETRNGPCTTIKVLGRPLDVSGELLNPQEDGMVKLESFSIGNMKGFESAIRMCGCGKLEPGDEVEITCTGSRSTGQESDMVLFKLKLNREGF